MLEGQVAVGKAHHRTLDQTELSFHPVQQHRRVGETGIDQRVLVIRICPAFRRAQKGCAAQAPATSAAAAGAAHINAELITEETHQAVAARR